jgi:hypothetical protein
MCSTFNVKHFLSFAEMLIGFVCFSVPTAIRCVSAVWLTYIYIYILGSSVLIVQMWSFWLLYSSYVTTTSYFHAEFYSLFCFTRGHFEVQMSFPHSCLSLINPLRTVFKSRSKPLFKCHLSPCRGVLLNLTFAVIFGLGAIRRLSIVLVFLKYTWCRSQWPAARSKA